MIGTRMFAISSSPFEEDIQYVLLPLSYAKSHIIPGTLPGMLQLSILYSHMMMSKSFCRPWGWGNLADEVYTLEHVEKGEPHSLISTWVLMQQQIRLCLTTYLAVLSLRTIFTRYLDFKAVPRRTFFQYLRYFNTDEQESEKLDEFLSVDTAVSISYNTHWSMLNSLAGRVIRLLPTRQAHNPRSAY